jgi:hypothetical protein
MSTPARTFAVIGARMARAEAAQELRDKGLDGRALIGDEQTRPPETVLELLR